MSKKELTKSDASALFCSKTASEPTYLQRWADSHRSTFEDCMERLADELPQKYAELYLKVMTLQQQAPPKQNKTDINTLNVNVGAKLDALGTVQDTSWRNDSAYTNYEEVKNEK